MKKISVTLLASFLFCISFVQSGCFGQFELTRSVYQWNDGISDSKVLKTLFFWVLNIIPVYGVAGVVDVLILNVIEFWSGDNPMGMNENEIDTQMVHYRGNDFQITATKNKMSVEQLSGKKKGAIADLVYAPENQTWSIECNNQKIKVAKYLKNLNNKSVSVVFYQPNGETLTVPYSDEGMAMIRKFAPNSEELVMN